MKAVTHLLWNLLDNGFRSSVDRAQITAIFWHSIHCFPHSLGGSKDH